MDNKLSKLRRLMKKEKIDALFISSLNNITYLTEFSGFSSEDRDAFLFITNSSQYIFTHALYTEAVGKYIKDFEIVEMKRENPVSENLKKFVSKYKIKMLGFEGFDLKVSEYERLLKFVNKKLLKSTDLIGKLRIHKSPHEIKLIHNACVLGDKTYNYILEKIKKDITEKELAYEMNNFIRKNGAEPSFPPIIAFGSNCSLPHHTPTDRKLKNNMFILMDFGIRLQNYCSDMTRTLFFGTPSKEEVRCYQAVLKSQFVAIDYLVEQSDAGNKIKLSDIDKKARDYILSENFPSIPHSLGHGIGLEVHELPHVSPGSEEILENGMVFSIEPGIYLPDNMGVRIEDLFAIENNKLVPLTHSPKELIEI